MESQSRSTEMICHECGGKNLQLDEVSRYYVCQDCFLVTGYSRGLVFDETPIGSRPEVHAESQATDLFAPIKLEPKPEEPIKSQSDSSTSSDSTSDSVKILFPKWRMSVAMNTTVRHFEAEFLMPAPRCYIDAGRQFRDEIDRNWQTYVQITGEIGGYHWGMAFRKVVKAIEKSLESRKSYIDAFSRDGRSRKSNILPSIKRARRGRQTELEALESDALQRHEDIIRFFRHFINPGIVWCGMSARFDPNKHKSDPFFPPFPNMIKKKKRFKRKRKSNRARAVDEDDETEDHDDIEEEENDELGEPVQDIIEAPPAPSGSRASKPKRRRRTATYKSLIGGISEEEKANMFEKKLSELGPFTRITDLNELEAVYEKLVKCMSLLPLSKQNFSFRQYFWQGTVGEATENRLLEYNLGIIYLSVMDMLSKTRVLHYPDGDKKFGIYIHEYFTMQDLATMCKLPRFPYLKADDLVVRYFNWSQSWIQRVFDRKRIPDPNLLAKVTNQLIHMIGYAERPRLPFCQMVHKYLRWMGLPLEVHLLADNFIVGLRIKVREAVKDKESAMHFYLPIQRYLRAEVVAMALVVISIRLMFKLDDDYEYRFSKVFTFLSENSNISERLNELVQDKDEFSQNVPSTSVEETRPFNYFEWASNFVRCPVIGITPRGRVRNDADIVINTATQYKDLCRLVSTSRDLLAPEDDLSDKAFKNPQKAELFHYKLDIVSDLRELNEEFRKISMQERTEDEGADPEMIRSIEDIQPSPCKSCRVSMEHRIFRNIENLHAVSLNKNRLIWTQFNCNAVYAAWEFMKRHELTVEAFLEMVFRDMEVTEELRETIQDWSYILSISRRYYTIHTCHFPTERDPRHAETFDLPDPVIDCMKFHEDRMRKLMAGEPLEPNALVTLFTDKSKDGDGEGMEDDSDENVEEMKKKENVAEASDSLTWIIELASLMCGATVVQLLDEIRCIEKMLGYGPPLTNRGTRRLEDLSLLYHLNCDIAPEFVLTEPNLRRR